MNKIKSIQQKILPVFIASALLSVCIPPAANAKFVTKCNFYNFYTRQYECRVVDDGESSTRIGQGTSLEECRNLLNQIQITQDTLAKKIATQVFYGKGCGRFL
jgi:hypothetical protein